MVKTTIFWSRRFIGTAAAIITTLWATGLEAQSGPVDLKSKDGSIAVQGELVLYESGVYVVDVPGEGLLKVEGANFTCSGAGCPEGALQAQLAAKPFSPKFGIHGSRTVGTTLIPNLLRGYAADIGATYELTTTDDPMTRVIKLTNADGSLRAQIDLQIRGSGSAFESLGAGTAEIGLADRRMKDSDLEKLAAGNIGELRNTASEQVIGVDGIVLITHKDNPVPNLSAAEVAAIWSGEITNWKDLGGGDVPITVNSFGEGSGDRAVLLDGLVRPLRKDEKADVSRWTAYQDMVDAVMTDRGGIGFVGRWLAQKNDVNQLAIREACGLLSEPSDFRMKIEGYTLSRRLYAYTRPGRVHPEAKAFLDWMQTDAAQPFIKQSNFVDSGLERMRLEDMGMMLIHTAAVEPDFSGAQYSRMMRELRNADRLSVSFRFRSGSSSLDAQSVRLLKELAGRIEAGEFDGLEVMLVGFADSIGDQARNTELARDRALAVRNILGRAIPARTLGRVKLTPLSYGELLPLSCNTDEAGRARNRRVEVWLRLPDSLVTLR
ncbi:MAG: phosphate ABC transporter substrate-binding/OmpA family protein [Pseudomonadota bacterium]